MKNKLNNEEQFLRDKLNQAEAEFNYQESDWQEIQQKLPKKGALGNYGTLLKAGIGFAILVAIAYLANTSWDDSEAIASGQEEKFSTIETSTTTSEESSKDLEEKAETTASSESMLNNKESSSSSVSEEKAIKGSDEKTVEIKLPSEKEQAVIVDEETETPIRKTQEEALPSVELKSLNIDGKACVESIISLSPNIKGADLSDLSYKWEIDGIKQSSVEASLDYKIEQSGLLKIELSAIRDNKIVASYGMKLNVPEVVKADFTYQDMATPYDDFSAEFTAIPEELENLKWEIKEIDATMKASTPYFNFGKKGVFDVTLIHTYKNGCTTEISKPVFIDQDFKTLAPNAFTPDGNDLNEAFIPVGFTPEAGIVLNDEFRMSIYDYNGTLVYSTTSNKQPWNGRLNNSGNVLPEGSYVWKVELKNSKGQEANYAGKVKIMY